jgi:hypothetical protein
MKLLFLVPAFIVTSLVSLTGQGQVSTKEWPMPTGHVTGLTKPGFKVVPVFSFENIRGEKHLILKMEISMGTVKDPVAPFSYRYTYRGKEYTDKELGLEPFAMIRMKTADFTVLVQGPRLSQKVEYEYIVGRKDLGAVSRDVGLSAFSAEIQSLDNVFYGGAEHIERAIKQFEAGTLQKTLGQNQPVPNPVKPDTVKKQAPPVNPPTTTVQAPKQEEKPIANNKESTTTDAGKTTTAAALPVVSQANSLEARAAYSLAEESYTKGDMRLAIQYLDEAVSKLGVANAKIQYLKVMALKALVAKDIRYAAELDAAIDGFEKAPDNAGFNEEKVLEVMKIKLERRRQKNIGAELEKGIAAVQQETGWFLGMESDSLILMHKELFDKHFQTYPSKKGKLAADGYEILQQGDGAFEMITLKKGVLQTYTRMFFSGDDKGYARLRERSPAIIDHYRQLFGSLPALDKKTTTTPSGNSNIIVNTYTYKWKLRDIAFYLITQETTYSLGTMSTCMITLTNDPAAQ